MKYFILIITVIMLSITGCSPAPKADITLKSDDDEIFQQALNAGADSIWGLLGAEHRAAA